MQKTQELNYSFTLEGHTYFFLMLTHGIITEAIPRHSHSAGSYEVHYISGGAGSLTVDGIVRPLTPGALFVTGPGIEHEQTPDPENPMQEDCLYFILEGDCPSPKNAPVTAAIQANPFWFGRDRQNLAHTIQMLHEELSLNLPGHSISVNACLQRYLVLLARNMTAAVLPEPKEMSPIQLKLEEAFLYRYRDLSLDDICEITGLCRRQTQRLLVKYYGCGFQQKRTAARMSAAAAFLTNSSYSVDTIAELTGYSCLSSFLQAFKAYYKMTTGEYRTLTEISPPQSD